MSDVAKWKVHGPVEALRTEFSTWDLKRDDWQPVEHFTLASFRSDGTISTTDTHNPSGSIAHSRWFYDDAGRVAESKSWMNDGPIDRTVYFYDEAGRHIRTMQLNHDGTETVLEVCSYDADRRKTKVRSLFPRESGSECGVGASTGYGIEGTDTAYGAPGAATMTVTYDENNLPSKVLFQDANHRPLNCVIFRRDSARRLLSEEMHQGERSPFQAIVDQAPPNRREEMAARLSKSWVRRSQTQRMYTMPRGDSRNGSIEWAASAETVRPIVMTPMTIPLRKRSNIEVVRQASMRLEMCTILQTA